MYVYMIQYPDRNKYTSAPRCVDMGPHCPQSLGQDQRCTRVCIPSKHETLSQWWFKVGPASTTLNHHSFNGSCLLGLCFRTCLQDNNIMVAAKLWDDNSKNLLANSHQSKARRWPYAGSMLVQRLRHNTNKWLDVLCQLGCRMTVSLCTM